MTRKFEWPALLALMVLLVAPIYVLAQKPGLAFPDGAATKVLDNNHVVVWDVTWAKGKSTGMHKLDMDQVSVVLTEGALKISRPDGAWSIERERFSTVRLDSKGTMMDEEGASDEPFREMVFQVKDYAPDNWPTRQGIPPQFPRINTVKLLETDRIAVWDQVWKPGEQVVLHSHYHPTATVFLSAGSMHARPENADAFGAAFSRKFGDVISSDKFSPSAHTEEWVSGNPRGVWIEFKK